MNPSEAGGSGDADPRPKILQAREAAVQVSSDLPPSRNERNSERDNWGAVRGPVASAASWGSLPADGILPGIWSLVCVAMS